MLGIFLVQIQVFQFRYTSKSLNYSLSMGSFDLLTLLSLAVVLTNGFTTTPNVVEHYMHTMGVCYDRGERRLIAPPKVNVVHIGLIAYTN